MTPLFILKTTPPIPYKEITPGVAYELLFFVLQMLFILFWVLKSHRDKIIITFANSLIVSLACIYALVMHNTRWVLNFPIMLLGLELIIVRFRRSAEEKKERYKISRETRRILIVSWFVLLVLIVCGYYWREIRWYWWQLQDKAVKENRFYKGRQAKNTAVWPGNHLIEKA